MVLLLFFNNFFRLVYFKISFFRFLNVLISFGDVFLFVFLMVLFSEMVLFLISLSVCFLSFRDKWRGMYDIELIIGLVV